MKKVLIITSKGSKVVSWQEREKYIRSFCEDLNTNTVKDITVTYTTYSDIYGVAGDGEPFFYDLFNNCKLDDYDFVQFKNWHGNIEKASVIARFFKQKNIPFVNNEVSINLAISKFSQAFLLYGAGVLTPRTLYASNETYLTQAETVLSKNGFVFPLILKATDGSKGDHNYLCKTVAQLKEHIKNDSSVNEKMEFVVQNLVPNDGDYRVLFIGSDEEPFVFKRTAVDDSHLNNTSKGGNGAVVPLSEIPKAYIDDSRKAAKAVYCEIAGVDIIVDNTTNKHYVLEVNSTPALATGFMVESKTKKFASFVEGVVYGD